VSTVIDCSGQGHLQRGHQRCPRGLQQRQAQETEGENGGGEESVPEVQGDRAEEGVSGPDWQPCNKLVCFRNIIGISLINTNLH